MQNLEELFKLANEAFEDLKDLDGKSRFAELVRYREKIASEDHHVAFTDHVYTLLQSYDEGKLHSGAKAEVEKPKNYITINSISIVAGFLALLLSFFELKLNFLLSTSIGFIAFLSTRALQRMFDRQFLFRRLFSTWLLAFPLLISAPTLIILIETKFGKLEWGGSPSQAFFLIWLVVFGTLGFLAYKEKQSEK